MRKPSIQIKIGLLLIFAVMLLSATCFLSYRNLSTIVSSIQVDLDPEMRLVNIREISHDLEAADNSVRIYTITRDTSDLKTYYSVVNSIDDKINDLKLECKSDSVMLNQADTISDLIEENIVTWNELLYLIDHVNVVDYLKHLSGQINNASVADEKKGILRRVFVRSNKNILSWQEFIDDIRKIEKQEQVNRARIQEREATLATTSNRIKEKFYDLIQRMEDQVTMLVREKGNEASELAHKTYIWLVLFSVSGGLLVLLVLYIIVRYISKAHNYQIALEKSKTETENLSRTRELFMANISHEIRTPVTAISGFTEQLINDTTDENALQSLKIIKSSSDHLAKIIDDILDLTKLQNSKLALEMVHFSLARLFNEVNQIFEPLARKKNISLNSMIKPGTPAVLYGDPYRLKQILINLLGNAVKFTGQGSVDFSAEGIMGNNGSVDLIIEVTDTGIGIEEDKLKIIFEDFVQAETSTTRKYGGTGLGLSIVKKLVELHGGTITCESRKNHGTRITCHLPVREGIENSISQDVTPLLPVPGEVNNLRILVVDDEEYNRLLLKKILERWKIKCDVAVSGLDAIEILKERSFDILFMDIRMPDIDGIKTVRFIRNDLKIPAKDMQVILISAGQAGQEFKSKENGIDAFIRKPFTEELLLSTILTVRKNLPQVISEEQEYEEIIKPDENQKINLNNLYHISGGDNNFVRQMLTSFNYSTGRGLSEMQEAVSSGDWDSVAYLAHKMMPPCRHIGAIELYSILKKIEESISKGNSAGIVEKMTGQAKHEFEIISNLLNEHISFLK